MAENTKVIVGVVVAAVAAIIIGLVATSLKKLNSFEVGVRYDTVWRKLDDDYKTQGLHNGPPGFEFITFPNVFKTIEFDNLVCLNKDGVPITLNLSYQYRPRIQHINEIIRLFRNHDNYIEVLEYAGSASIHEACSKFNTSQFQAERGNFQETVGTTLGLRNDPLYCDVSKIQVSNIARPGEYEGAVQAKEAAKENIRVALNERPRLITEAETAKKQADKQAEITIAQAQSSARIILNKAQLEAAAILNVYETEAVTYADLMSAGGLGLSEESFLSYIGIRAISNAKNPVYIGMKSPAKTSYVNV